MDPLAYVNSYLDDEALCPGGGALPRVTLNWAKLTTFVRIRAEVTTQAHYVISKSIFFVKTNFETMSQALNYVMNAVLECHWNTRLKMWLHCRSLSSSGIHAKQ